MRVIERFIRKQFSKTSSSKDRIRRIHEFKRLVMNMPYTQTHYLYKQNPNSMFREDEFEARTKGDKKR